MTTKENGIEVNYVNGVDKASVEDQFFEDISEPTHDTYSMADAEVITLHEEEIQPLQIDTYSPEELSHLQQVLERYAELQEWEGERHEQLKKELDSTALKESEENGEDNENGNENNNNNNCHCCGQALSFFLNRGKPCAQCTSTVCARCLKEFREGVTRICQICYMEDIHEGRSGKWFMMNLQKSGRSPIFGTDILRASIKRHKEEEQRRLIAEQEEKERQAALEAEAAAAAAMAAADDKSSRRSSKSEGRSIGSVASSLPAMKKWKIVGKKSKKGSDATDSIAGTSVLSNTPRSVHEERSVDVDPSVIDSDLMSSASHAPSMPAAIEIEEGATTVSDPNERLSIVPSIVVEEPGREDEDPAIRRDYVNEENHIFPEDEPEVDILDRPPSHMLSANSMSQESVLSIYSDTSAGYRLAVDVTGDVLVGLDYDFKHSIFFAIIKQCRDVAAIDTKRKKSDPYIKTYLLPDKTKVSKRKTSYRKNTLNPIFDEQLKYVISKSELETRVLSVAVWHRVAFGHNIFLGEALIPLEDYEFGDPSPKWYPLHEKRDIAIPMPLMMYKGDLILAVKYVPGADLMNVSSSERGNESKGEVHAWIKEAKNLVAARTNGYSDPFCKGYLLPDKSKHGKKKTRVLKRNLNPAWNTVLRFTDVEEEELPDRCLELTIWDYGRFSSNEFLGGLRLNLGIGIHKGQHVKWMDSKGHEITMWQAMISRPNTWIEGTLMLRPNMD